VGDRLEMSQLADILKRPLSHQNPKKERDPWLQCPALTLMKAFIEVENSLTLHLLLLFIFYRFINSRLCNFTNGTIGDITCDITAVLTRNFSSK
jgi:hypothetical protein